MCWMGRLSDACGLEHTGGLPGEFTWEKLAVSTEQRRAEEGGRRIELLPCFNILLLCPFHIEETGIVII